MIDDYAILVFWSPEDGECVAVVPDLRGCSASGATPEQAVQEARTAGRLWLDAARDNGYAIPAPTPASNLVPATT